MIDVILGLAFGGALYFIYKNREKLMKWLKKFVKEKISMKPAPKQVIVKEKMLKEFAYEGKESDKIAALQAMVDRLNQEVARLKEYMEVRAKFDLNKMVREQIINKIVDILTSEKTICERLPKGIKVLTSDDVFIGYGIMILEHEGNAYILIKDTKGKYRLVPDPSSGLKLSRQELIANYRNLASQIRAGYIRLTIDSHGKHRREIFVLW